MELKTSGETMQSLNNASRRCAHVSAIFSPPGFALPKLGAGREAIVFTTRYVMQQGAKERQTVGLWADQGRGGALRRACPQAWSQRSREGRTPSSPRAWKVAAPTSLPRAPEQTLPTAAQGASPCRSGPSRAPASHQR